MNKPTTHDVADALVEFGDLLKKDTAVELGSEVLMQYFGVVAIIAEIKNASKKEEKCG